MLSAAETSASRSRAFPAKAYAPMLFAAGKETLVSVAEAFAVSSSARKANASSPTKVTFSPLAAVSSVLAKARAPTEVMLVKSKEVSDVPSKAKSPTVATEAGRTISSSAVFMNTPSAMASSPAGRVTDVSAVQSAKAYSPIISTPSGMATRSSAVQPSNMEAASEVSEPKSTRARSAQ